MENQTTSSAESQKKKNLKLLEAIFFVSGKYLSMSELIALSNLDPATISELIESLKRKYNGRDSAIVLIEKNGLWKMDVCPEYSWIAHKYAGGSSEFSKAEQETLAIIAYKQPIKQSIVVKIRGNKAYDHIKKFVELNLVKRKKMGHTWELELTEEFYNYFKLAEKS